MEIPPCLALPPLLFCLGVSPKAAERCRPEVKFEASPIVATTAEAVIGPTPGIFANRRLASLPLCHSRISASSSSICVSTASI